MVAVTAAGMGAWLPHRNDLFWMRFDDNASAALVQ
jgi:hypothetical protein